MFKKISKTSKFDHTCCFLLLMAIQKIKYSLTTVHSKYLLKFFQFFFKYWIFIHIIQYIPVYGLGGKKSGSWNAYSVRIKTETMVTLLREQVESRVIQGVKPDICEMLRGILPPSPSLNCVAPSQLSGALSNQCWKLTGLWKATQEFRAYSIFKKIISTSSFRREKNRLNSIT